MVIRSKTAVAGLLADYLRINDAPELAAMILIEFPYSRTAVPASEVVSALASEKKRGQRGVFPATNLEDGETKRRGGRARGRRRSPMPLTNFSR